MTRGSVNALQQSIPGQGKDIPDELGKRIYRLERSTLTRVAMSYPMPLQRDEPFEEGTQTNKIVAPQGILRLETAVAITPQNVVLVNGINDNIPIGNGACSVIYITGPTAGFSLGGFVGGADGRLLIAINLSGFQMTIKQGSAGSAVGNKLATLAGVDVVLRAGNSAATFMWLAFSNNWILLNSN